MQNNQTYWQKSSDIVGPSKASEFGQIGQQETRNAFEGFILSNSSPSSRVLDAGCNTGVEGFRLTEKGYVGEYVGVDSNAKALTHALVNLSGRRAMFLAADLASIPLRSQSFEIVLNKDVIEHCSGYRAIIQELARLSSRFLIISFFIKLHDAPDIITQHPDGYFLNRYCRPEFIKFVSELGFSPPTTIFEKGEDEVLVFQRLAD